MMNARMIAAIAVFSLFSSPIIADDKAADAAGHSPHSSDDHGHDAGHSMMGADNMSSPHSKGMGMGSASKDFPKAPEGPILIGKVVEVIVGGGYSYLRLDENGEQVWVAGIQIDAKVGDTVGYVENVTMAGFTSKALDKTFDKIVFASSVKVQN